MAAGAKPRLTMLLHCVLLFVVIVVRGYDDRYIVHQPYTDLTEDAYSNLSTNEEVESVTPPSMDPKGSWIQFVRHSDRLNNKRSSRNRRKKKRKTLVGVHTESGPPGPPGPPGPVGPAGAAITKDELMVEFKQMVKEAAEKRANELLTERCEACSLLLNGSYVPPPELEDMFLVPRVTAAFRVRLRSNILVARRTFMELKKFHQPFGEGAFNRGNVFNDKNGRFLAPKDALYQFSANLHLLVKRKGRNNKRLRKKDNIKILICIQSLCQENTSLEYITGLETNSKLFTASVSGLLQLKAGQYASVYVDNSSGIMVKIQADSDFSGVLFGV